MSHVTQINSLVKFKHSFLHSPKRLAPKFSWLVSNWKHLEHSFKQFYRDPEPQTLVHLKRQPASSLKNCQARHPDNLDELYKRDECEMLLKLKGIPFVSELIKITSLVLFVKMICWNKIQLGPSIIGNCLSLKHIVTKISRLTLIVWCDLTL